jgi:cAMP-dependent protein kinase regulator
VCRATKVVAGSKDIVVDLKAGQYFGELALLNDAPRAASVVAIEPVVLASLDRACFSRLLGPCEAILSRNAAKYSEYEAKSYETKLAAVRGSAGNADDAAGPDLETLKKQTASRRRRASVSSESVNMKSFETPVDKLETFPKSIEQRERILASISKNFLFSSLDKTQIDLVIDTMREMKFKPGQNLITQGDTGDFFYVVDDGVAECFVKKGKDDAPIKVKVYNHGESFGELALMYNCPRAATITAKTNVTAWAMERVPFRRILCETTSQRRVSYEGFLESIPLLSSLDRYERAKISDALVEKTFTQGEQVIKMGDAGDNFYIIEDGEAAATKPNNKGKEVELMKYSRGSYFGELALLQDVPRAANVTALTDLKTIFLDRAAFVRLLGPCDDILKRNADNYSKMQARLG